MFDGNTLSSLSLDIADFFDQTSENAINLDVADTFTAFFDENMYEYHWLCATGGSSTINREMVLDLRRHKWFEIDRGTGKHITCGFRARDGHGNTYVYGGTSDGHLELLENGNTFDGNNIDYTFWFGDTPLLKSLMYEANLRRIKLVGRAKNISAATVTCTVYIDSAPTGTTLTGGGISQADATRRVYGLNLNSTAERSTSFKGTTHSLKFNVSTNNETIGFEPLLVGGFFEAVREDM